MIPLPETSAAGGKVQLALAEQRGKAHKVHQGTALARQTRQAHSPGWNKEHSSGDTVQGSSPTNAQTQVHGLPSGDEDDPWPALKSEKLIMSLVVV